MTAQELHQAPVDQTSLGLAEALDCISELADWFDSPDHHDDVEAAAEDAKAIRTLLAAHAADREEIWRLNTRLENNHAWIDGVLETVHPGSIPDGIECRDETITQQDASLTRIRSKLDMAMKALEEARDLLLERVQGSPARSAGHNARLVIEATLKDLTK